jgi:double-stranded uracil-DNA glycosylase
MTCVLDYSIFVMRRGRDKKQLGSQGDSIDRVHSVAAAARRPTRTELLAAADKTVPDIIGPGLKILFCGINPGLYSAWAGHHFARPGNRFWPALFAGGFTERLLRPEEEQELLRFSYGITNLVERATVGSEELTREELMAGGRVFARKVATYRPRAVAILGVSAFRLAFSSPKAVVGAQPERMAGALVWVLPNPSGLNAHFTPSNLARLFRKFRRDVLR